jgi:hypothetical protein
MTKKLVLFATSLFAITLASTANASVFTLNDYTVTYQTSDPGLVLWESDILASGSTFTLDSVGDAFTASLFTIGTNELALNLDDLAPKDINVAFQFTAPPPAFGGATNGISGAFWLGTGVGYVLWESPLLLSFGTTGVLAITLSNALFTLPGAAEIYARFELVRADIGTPEPAAIVFMIMGALLAMSALWARRSRTWSRT